MIERAKSATPEGEFILIENEGDLSAISDREFDYVFILGILHLHKQWRNTLRAGYKLARRKLIFDTREISGTSIEDISKSSFEMDYDDPD